MMSVSRGHRLLFYLICFGAANTIESKAHGRQTGQTRTRYTHALSKPTIPMQLAASQTICYASHEIECFRQPSGGLGRAFLRQAAFLKRNKFNVKLIMLSVSKDDNLKKVNSCTDNKDASLMANDVIFPSELGSKTNMHWTSYASVQLMTWLQTNPNVCSILHVPDWGGDAAMAVAAKKAGLAFMDNLAINVQVHGSDSLINHASSTAMDLANVYINAQERAHMRHSDSAVFLSRSNYDVYKEIWQLPPRIDIIPNMLASDDYKSDSEMPASWPVNVEHIFFYGKMTDGKGLSLFVQGIKLCQLDALNGKTIHLIGPRWDKKDYIADLRDLQSVANVSLAAHYDLNTREVGRLFRSHRHNGIVVLPTLIEHQSYALYDVFATGAPFIASNIFAHKADIPVDHHGSVLFDITPLDLALTLSSYLQDTFEWTSAQTTWTPVSVAERRWIRWHKRMLAMVSSQSKRPPMRTMNISISVAVCHTSDNIGRAVRSIQRQRNPLLGDIDVHVLASCPIALSCTGITGMLSKIPAVEGVSVSCIDAAPPQPKLKHASFILTHGQASNYAVAAAKHDAVLLIDESDELSDGSLVKYATALQANPKHAVVISFINVYEAGMHHKTLKQQTVKELKTFVGPMPEMGFLATNLGPKQMLVQRRNVFWNISNGFSEEPSLDCAESGLLLKAALVDALVLVPQPLIMHQETNQDRTGWSEQKMSPKNVAHVRCRTYTIKEVIGFMNRYKEMVDLRVMLTDLLYLHNFLDS